MQLEELERDVVEVKLAERLKKVKKEQALAREAISSSSYTHDENGVRDED